MQSQIWILDTIYRSIVSLDDLVEEEETDEDVDGGEDQDEHGDEHFLWRVDKKVSALSKQLVKHDENEDNNNEDNKDNDNETTTQRKTQGQAHPLKCR